MQPQTKDSEQLSISIDLDAIIGEHAKERHSPQPLQIILTVFSPNLTRAELEKSLDSPLKEYAQKEKPHLLEALAYGLSLKLLTLHPQINDFLLTIKKPEAIKEARCAYASIHYRRVEQASCR